MQIALFGGRFDPVHNGHIAIVKEVLKMRAADKVWFSLENQHQWRPIVASVVDRATMLELAIKGMKNVAIDMTPVKLGGLTETITVVRELRKTMTDQIVFVCGSDQLPTFPKWTKWLQLQKEVQFLIVARKGFPMEHVPPNAIVLQDPTYEPLEDSATRIREYIKIGKSIHGLVPNAVEEYIITHKLYQ